MTAPIKSPIWQPSAARTVIITPPSFVRARGLVQTVYPLSWGMKSSADNLDYYLDASEVLCCTKDYIARVDASVISGDITISWVSVVDGMAALYLGGGTPGTTQCIQVDMHTQQGRIISQPMLIGIDTTVPLTAPETVPRLPDYTAIPPNALTGPDKKILTLGPSVTTLTATEPLLTPDRLQRLLTLDGKVLTDADYSAHTDILLIA